MGWNRRGRYVLLIIEAHATKRHYDTREYLHCALLHDEPASVFSLLAVTPRLLLTIAAPSTLASRRMPRNTSEGLSENQEGRPPLTRHRGIPEAYDGLLHSPGQLSAASGSELAKKSKDDKSAGPTPKNVASSLKMHATLGQRGFSGRSRYFYHYSFQNIRLTRDEIQFFTSPGVLLPSAYLLTL